jgi:hypothetical protein
LSQTSPGYVQGEGSSSQSSGERAGAPNPLRFVQPLEDAIRAEYLKHNEPSQRAAKSQLQSACERVQEALGQGHFGGDALAACQALASAAVQEARKPGGKLGFALGQVQFVGTPSGGLPGSGNGMLRMTPEVAANYPWGV